MRSREDRRTIIVARSHLAESQGHLLWAPWLSDQAMRRNYLLAFDGRRGTGVREHFFHFLWGYLLPAAHDIIELQSDCLSHPLENEFIFVSCGPVMDTKTAEMAGFLGVEYSIVRDEREARKPGTTNLVVRRWDSYICDYAGYSRLRLGAATLRLLRQAVKYRSIPPILWSKPRVVREIQHVRHTILAKVPPRDEATPFGDDPPCYYILKRSEEPAFYAPEGGRAERRTYGTSRRSLLGIEEAAVALSRQSHRVAVFEPGRHTLAEQIRTFRNCKGIIAIRGAELANIVWMNPTSKVIVINAGKFHLSAPPAWGLAKLLGIRYIEIDWGEDPYPRLGNELVQRISNHLAS